MRKFAFVASVALIAAAFGGWMSMTTTALVAPPANGAGIDPIQIMVGSPNSAYPALRRLFVHLSEQLIVCRADSKFRPVADSGGSGRGS